MIKIENVNNDSMSAENITMFLNSIDHCFPIPLSDRVDIEKYAKKQLEYGVVITAMDNREIIGIILGYINDRKTSVGYIGTIGVNPDYQSKGVGSLLLEEMKKKAIAAGMIRLSLFTHKTNTTAINFYKKHGFSITETDSSRPNDYHMILNLI